MATPRHTSKPLPPEPSPSEPSPSTPPTVARVPPYASPHCILATACVSDTHNPPSRYLSYIHISLSGRDNTSVPSTSAHTSTPPPTTYCFCHRGQPMPLHLLYGCSHRYSKPGQSSVSHISMAHHQISPPTVRDTLQQRRYCSPGHISSLAANQSSRLFPA